MKRYALMLTSLLLSALLTACGAVQGSSGGSDSAPGTTVAESMSPSAGAQAVSVTYTRAGGLAGIFERNHYALDEPPPDGLSRAEVKAVLRAASNPAVRTLQMTPLPKDKCCDRFSYFVTITWRDGTSRTYKSLDGVEQPAAFYRLLGQIP